jgi:hypothetical protein
MLQQTLQSKGPHKICYSELSYMKFTVAPVKYIILFFLSHLLSLVRPLITNNINPDEEEEPLLSRATNEINKANKKEKTSTKPTPKFKGLEKSIQELD